MTGFAPATQAWFDGAFAEPTEVQRRGFEAIASGQHVLLVAPTGSGKTLAAFLSSIDRLSVNPVREPGVRTLYVSPLKALVYDIERNLRVPLAGIASSANALGIEVCLPEVAIRTGDTSAKSRRQQLAHPGQILVTTPESLYLLLGSRARETLRTVDTVIVDEIHALAPSKRGAHLAVSLERLCAITQQEPQRIGLSATARPTAEVARFLGGHRPVTVIDAGATPLLDLQIQVPVADMTRPEQTAILQPNPPATKGEHKINEGAVGDHSERNPSSDTRAGERGMWPAIYPRLLEEIREHNTTIIFVNSRGLCERLCNRLNDLAGEPLVRAHHGSISHSERKQVEEDLKAGHIAGIVATSSLELGVDMGTVDLVILVESPGSTASGLQRIGRAGHGVGEISVGRVFPKHRGDLLEATVVAHRMRQGAIEALSVPNNPLDVLAQHIVAAVATDPWQLAELETMLRRSANFADLPRDALTAVLDMLSGRYPSTAFADLRPRINWDRDTGELTPRRGAKMLAIVNGGTIPDRGMYGVFLGDGGPRVGELDEEMVHETQAGETFTLGASTWRVEQITRDRVIVRPAPGEIGKLPFWRGDGIGRPIELGRELGQFVREIGERTPESAAAWLQEEHHLDVWAAQNLVAYIAEQKEHVGALPTDHAITIERFRDEIGDWRICILSPFGSRVHAPWALALEARLSAATGFDVQALWSNDGIAVRFADGDELPDLEVLLPDPDEIEDLIVDRLGQSSLFAGQFRENASRSLLLPRRRPEARTPLWLARLKSQELLAVAREYPSFPVVMETYRSCLQDVFDVPALVELVRAIQRREVRVDHAETASASPFARSLVFAYVAAYLYESDAPIAERRAQALSLDRNLLRELLGQEELRELFDAEIIETMEAELSGRADEWGAKSADELADLLRRVGDLTEGELAQRTEGDAALLLAELVDRRRAFAMRIGGEQRFVAVEDVALYRDALGASPPAGVAATFLEPTTDPTTDLFRRYARSHGPFTSEEVAQRYAIPPAQAQALLSAMADRQIIVRGEFRPGRLGLEWCDTEILRRIKRRTLAKLRGEVAPVNGAILGRFLPAWHGIAQAGGKRTLQEVIIQLEGLPLSYRELETAILPARIADFRPSKLDELGATGWLVWVGAQAQGAAGGKIALYRRDRVAALLDPPSAEQELGEVQHAILAHLKAKGASFFVALQESCSNASKANVLSALWDLVWAGLVTNDTFGPLRAIGTTSKSKRAANHAASGRWSLVADLLAGAPSTTERAHSRAVKLLERHGIVCREVSNLESAPGGFSALYSVLRMMEEAGKVRRGYFVEGLGAAQFAFPGAVDRLRAVNRDTGLSALVLSATDPANPFGWLLPWPATAGESGGAAPRRVAGATLVLVGGEPALYLDKSGRRLVTFAAAKNRDVMVHAAHALRSVAAHKRGKYLRIELIDEAPARTSSAADALLASGFFADHRGLVIESS